MAYSDLLKIDLSRAWRGERREAVTSARDKKTATYHQMKGLLLKLLTNEVPFLLEISCNYQENVEYKDNPDRKL